MSLGFKRLIEGTFCSLIVFFCQTNCSNNHFLPHLVHVSFHISTSLESTNIKSKFNLPFNPYKMDAVFHVCLLSFVCFLAKSMTFATFCLDLLPACSVLMYTNSGKNKDKL